MADIPALDSRFIAASRSLAKVKVIGLKRGAVIWLEKNSGVTKVEAKDGIVWLTGTPANGDVLLQQGDRFELKRDWPYVIQALERAEVSLLYS